MSTKSPPTLEDRVKLACAFKDSRYYMIINRYFDVIVQVHSIVLTQRGTIVLRCWRATEFGPPDFAARFEHRKFRVTQNIFFEYVAPPDPIIGRAIQKHGIHWLLEVEIYGEHVESLKGAKSGDFVALQNLHAASVGGDHSLKFHETKNSKKGAEYHRGLTVVPDNFDNEEFQAFRNKCVEALQEITDSHEFKGEFFTEEELLRRRRDEQKNQEEAMEEEQEVTIRVQKNPVENENQEEDSFDDVGKEQDEESGEVNRVLNILIGEKISVDCFQETQKCEHFFLTHAHSDHCTGLDTTWNKTVYCSETTALILPTIMGFEKPEDVPDGLISSLKADIPHKIGGFQVTLIDAHHCPGAVMFVFDGEEIQELEGGPVLCTGDFRADKQFIKNMEEGNKLNWLTEKKFAKIYLDNTYLSLDMTFPERRDALEMIYQEVLKHTNKNIYLPMNRLGREDILEKLNTHIGEPIFVYEEKNAVASELGFYFEVGMESLYRKIEVVKKHGYSYRVPEDSVIIDTSMVHHLMKHVRHARNIIRMPYSDHSSRSEIFEFLSFLRYKQILPTSNKCSERDMKKMMSFELFQEEITAIIETFNEDELRVMHDSQNEDNLVQHDAQNVEEEVNHQDRSQVEESEKQDDIIVDSNTYQSAPHPILNENSSMSTKSPPTLEDRVKLACAFNDSRYYMIINRYFDVIVQVHSIVSTHRGTMLLRGWRATEFGPPDFSARFEHRKFRVTQQMFHQYVAPPNPIIGRAIQKQGIHWLLEIEIYGEHVESLKGVKSGDFVALQNIHAASVRGEHSLKFYETKNSKKGAKYHRGLSVVPEDFDNEEFQAFRNKCVEALQEITDSHEFKGEFFTEEESSRRRRDEQNNQEEAMEEQEVTTQVQEKPVENENQEEDTFDNVGKEQNEDNLVQHDAQNVEEEEVNHQDRSQVEESEKQDVIIVDSNTYQSAPHPILIENSSMSTDSPPTLEDRVKLACAFIDSRYYMIINRYFDVIVQVHSIVLTQRRTIVLRCWRATEFGPPDFAARFEHRKFRVTQQMFYDYVAPPNPIIGRAIQKHGIHWLLEIEIYGEHVESLKGVKSGDFVALQNVHAASNREEHSLKFHETKNTKQGAKYNRGLSVVPEDFDNEEFQAFRNKCVEALQEITDSHVFKEEFFIEEELLRRRRGEQENQDEDSAYVNRVSKILIGEKISVDCFQKTQKCEHFFLTHAHSDHCTGLDTTWNKTVYCSETTARILPIIMGFEKPEDVPDGLISPLTADTPHKIGGFQVTLIDAHHCPGAVMFVFDGDEIQELEGGPVLCTGDFRADKQFIKNMEEGNKLNWLTEKKFAKIYLDNTYLSLDMTFPERRDALEMIYQEVQKHTNKNIYLPMNRLGREDILEKLNTHIGEPIFVYEEKNAVASELGFDFEVGMESLYRKIEVVKKHGYSYRVPEDSVIIDTSMVHHLMKHVRHARNIIRMPYSDHSSRSEIFEFLSFLRYKQILPTSNKCSERDMKKMMSFELFQEEVFAEMETSNEDEIRVMHDSQNEDNLVQHNAQDVEDEVNHQEKSRNEESEKPDVIIVDSNTHQSAPRPPRTIPMTEYAMSLYAPPNKKPRLE